MSSINKVTLIGNLCSDPETRYTPNGQAVTNLRLATNRKWKNKEGKTQENAEFHRIVVWGKQAEACQEYLAKGRQIYVEGRLQTRSWEDKDGVKRFTTEVVAQSVQFLGSSQKKEQNVVDQTSMFEDMENEENLQAVGMDETF